MPAHSQFTAWKQALITQLREEESRILLLGREKPEHESDDEDEDERDDEDGDERDYEYEEVNERDDEYEEVSDDDEKGEEYWGYSVRPSRHCPFNDVFIEWIYVIDLDLNIFRVSDSDFTEADMEGVKFFRLENIPRALFTHDAITSSGLDFPVMGDSIPSEHMAADPAEIPVPSPSLLALYSSLSPTPTATFTTPAVRRNPVWHNLYLRILSAFVPYYAESFRDAIPSLTCSPYVFRQLAYAILSLTSTPVLKFHPTSIVYIDRVVRTPTWEPPDEDTYWLGDVLIVLNPHIATTSSGAPSVSTKASIALASELASGNPTTAVLFSVHAIMLVKIALEGITHTPILPLFTLDATKPPFTDDVFDALDDIGFGTPGVLALLDLFAVHPRVKNVRGRVPALLPPELWRAVVGFADEQVRLALEGTCRCFRDLVGEYPRFGRVAFVGWKGDVWELAGGGVGNLVTMDEVNRHGLQEEWDQLQLGGWGLELSEWGKERIDIRMPLLGIQWDE